MYRLKGPISMGLILKKEELGSEDDFDIIERSDTPEDQHRTSED